MAEKQRYSGRAMESLLENVGTFYLVFSVFAAFVCFASASSEYGRLNGLTYLFSGLAIGMVIQGAISRVLFRAGAEVIRLLKKQNGLPYEGVISTISEEASQLVCNACGTSVIPEARYCTNCGSEFEEENNE